MKTRLNLNFYNGSGNEAMLVTGKKGRMGSTTALGTKYDSFTADQVTC